MKKKIFISFSDLDMDKVKMIKRSIDLKQNFEPFVAADIADPAKSLSDKVREGIRKCDYFVPILTRNSIDKQWINQEIGFAFGRKKWIFPLVEKSVTKSLKGFINEQLDLSFTFEEHSKKSSFGTIVKKLAKYLDKIETLTIQDLFPGEWECRYNGKKLNGLEKVMINGSNYLKNGVPTFKMDIDKLDFGNKKFSYTKTGLDNTSSKGRIIKGELKIKDHEKKYTGTETENNDTTQILYIRLDV